MAVNLSPLGGAGAQFFTNDGVPLTGGLLYTYLAGTSTPATTYTSSSGATALANPIILDAAGRVPTGEIWLSDGISYKFVLKDSTDVLIATWDGLSGINSNFIAYTAVEETATATAGQTVFNTTLNYIPATNNLAVFVNGSNQIVNVNYLETDDNTVTFLTGLNVGDVVKFSTASPVATNAMDAANVSYTPAGGTNAVVTNVQAKLRQTVSVKDFGATGDGVTDDSDAFNNAIASSESVYVPAGTYILTTVELLANTHLYGDGAASILKQKETTAATWTRMLFARSASNSTYVENITIENLQLLGNSASGLVEVMFLLSLEGTINTIVSNCLFKAFQGDGIYVGWEVATGDADCRNCKDVLITNCIFDGVDNNNRQCISVVGGDGVTISNNVFKNSTDVTMPGAIDVEIALPNNAGTGPQVLKNIIITGNQFYNCGGYTGCIDLNIANYLGAKNFVISNNVARTSTGTGGETFVGVKASTTGANYADIVISGNTSTYRYPFYVVGTVYGIVIDGNTFEALSNGFLGNVAATDYVGEVVVSNNRFQGTPGTTAQGLYILRGDGINIIGNTFKFYTSYGAIIGHAGAVSNCAVVGNTFLSITNGITVLGANAGVSDAGATNTYANNVEGSYGPQWYAWKTDNIGNIANTNTAVTFNLQTAANVFSNGVSRAFLNGNTTDWPASNTPVGVGILTTYRFLNPGVNNNTIYQELHPAADAAGTYKKNYYVRKVAWNSTTWDAWAIVGS
jgi:polygalacturonase